MKSEVISRVLFLILLVGRLPRKTESLYQCSVAAECSCSTVDFGAYEVTCFRNVTGEYSSEDMHLFPQELYQILYAEFKQGYYAKFQCSQLTEWEDLRLLTAVQIENSPAVTFSYCPLPDITKSSANFSSFKGVFDSLHVDNVITLSFKSYRKLENALQTEHLEGLKSIEKLILSNNELTSLPDNVFSGVPNLRLIDLKNNNIILPASVFQGLPFLDSIELGNNGIRNLPPSIFNGLHNLTHLNLWKNKLSESNLSRSHFKDLLSLESLDLNSNALISLDEDLFNDLLSLRILNLNANNFTSLPGSLFIKNNKLERLRLNDNRVPLQTLPSGLLSNLTHLTNLSLDRCGIETLPGDLLRGSVNLLELSLRNNKLKTLPIGLLSDSKKLETIYLNDNQLISLPNTSFVGLKYLKILWLQNNMLNYIPPSLLHDLESLEELNLKSNKIKTLDSNACAGNKNLRRLYLSNNQLTISEIVDSFVYISPFQSCLGLEILDLSNNSLEHIFSDWKFSMLKLKVLNLSHNSISELSSNDLHFLTDKLTVDLRYNQLNVIYLFDIDTLAKIQPEFSAERNVKVYIDNNPIRCDCNVYPLLKYLEGRSGPQAKRLVDIKVNNLSCSYPNSLLGHNVRNLNSYNFTCELGLKKLLDEEDEEMYQRLITGANSEQLKVYSSDKCPALCHCLFRPEDRGLIVDCRKGNLTRLPRTLPAINVSFHTELLASDLGLKKLWSVQSLPLGYSRIEVLKLGGNALSVIDAKILPPKLSVLELQGNNLTHLSKDVIAAFSNVSEISLHGNPWKCDCDTRDLLEFLQDRFKQVKFLPNVTCKSGKLEKKPLSQLTVSDLCPVPTDFVVITSISLAVFGLIIGALAALYYRYQEAVNIWLYAHQICLCCIDEDDKDKEYDAFISYSHQDEDFVMGELVPRLEGGNYPDKPTSCDSKDDTDDKAKKANSFRYKLCLHYRDWIAGEWIPAQIARSVESSRRTIVILSPSFLESVWGKMEFRTAHCRALKEGRSRVIVILYGDVPPTDTLDPELRTYLATNTYVKWGDPWFWQKLRYALRRAKPRKEVGSSLTFTSDLDIKHLQNGNGPFELIPTNPPLVEITKNR